MKFFTSIFFLVMVQMSFCQEGDDYYLPEPERKFKPRAIYGGGNLLGGYAVNFEFILFENQKRFYKSNGVRIAGGQEWGTGFDAAYFGILYNLFFGMEQHHYELGFGAALAFKYGSFSGGNIVALPAFTTGYRYQKPEGKFVFKTGIGFPEVVYLGLGFCF